MPSALNLYFCSFDRFCPSKLGKISALSASPQGAGPAQTKKFFQPSVAGHTNTSQEPWKVRLCSIGSCHSNRSDDLHHPADTDSSEPSCSGDDDQGTTIRRQRMLSRTGRLYTVKNKASTDQILYPAAIMPLICIDSTEETQQIKLVEGRRIYFVEAAPWPRQQRVHPSEQYKSYQMGWSKDEMHQMRQLARRRREMAAAFRRERDTRRFKKPVYCLPKDLVSENKARLLRWFKVDPFDDAAKLQPPNNK